MKYLLFLFTPFLYFSQNIRIEIPEDKIIQLSSEKDNQICFNIRNNSDDDYQIFFDRSGFSTAENEAIDDLYIGVSAFRIFENESLLKPLVNGSYGYTLEVLKQDTIEQKEFERFSKKNENSFKSHSDLYISYKIIKRLITLKAGEQQSICMNVSLPIYRSLADEGSLFYNLENGKKYYFQIFLNVPDRSVKKYIAKLKRKEKLFTGFLISNKIQFVYKE
jgi:hypothetical protein